MTQFDNYEIHPVIGLDQNNQPTRDPQTIVAYEPCNDDDPDLLGWSVFGHLPAGGLHCVADCELKDDAELVYQGLMERLTKPSLLDAALSARALLEPRQQPTTIRATIGDAVRRERTIRSLDAAIAGAMFDQAHVLIPVSRASIRGALPDIESDQLIEVMEVFRERLEDDIVPEYLPSIANETCTMGARK